MTSFATSPSTLTFCLNMYLQKLASKFALFARVDTPLKRRKDSYHASTTFVRHVSMVRFRNWRDKQLNRQLPTTPLTKHHAMYILLVSSLSRRSSLVKETCNRHWPNRRHRRRPLILPNPCQNPSLRLSVLSANMSMMLLNGDCQFFDHGRLPSFKLYSRLF